MINIGWRIGGLSALLLCGSALPAFAAEATADAVQPGPRTTLEEVVVTARKRAEGVEHVPATVSVLTSESLAKQSIHTEADLQIAVPGLIVRPGGNNSQFAYIIRGESLDAYSGSIPGVQPYFNEIPLTSNNRSSFYDIENVQVLKGPQGTLFGRNTTGGAVLYQTTRPKDEFGGYASVQYGNLDRLITDGAINLPIVEDKVLLRLAGTYTSGGAFMHNLYDGRYLGDQQEQSGRATLLLKPIEKLSNLTTFEYSTFGGTIVPNSPSYIIPCGQPGGAYTCAFEPSNPAFEALINPANIGKVLTGYPNGFVYPGGLASLVGFLHSQGPYAVDLNAPFSHTGNNLLLANTTNYDLTPQITIKNVFGYAATFTGTTYDNSALPYPILQATPGDRETEGTKDISDELQIQGKAFSNRLTYILGGYIENEKDDLNSALVDTVLPSFFQFPLRYHIGTEEQTYAVFSQETFALTDKLNLTAGIRGTWVTLTSEQRPDSILFGVGNPHQQTNESNPSWNVTVDYHFTPELMTYVATRGSWRIGGYNPTAAPIGNTSTGATGGNYFLPETVRDVEVGAKFNGRVGDIPVQLNMDAYRVWAYDIQKVGYATVPGSDGAPAMIESGSTNVPAGTVTGVEGDFQIRPTSHLRLGGNISYDDAEFTQNQGSLFGFPTNFGPYGDAPRYSGSLFAEVNIPLAENYGSLTYRVDGFAQSSFYVSNTDNTTTPHTKVPGYAIVDMRLDWANPIGAKGVTLSAFVKNLGDKLYFVGGGGTALTYSDEQQQAGPPRTYGFVVR